MVCGKLCSKALDDEWYIPGSLRPSIDSMGGGFRVALFFYFFFKKKKGIFHSIRLCCLWIF